MKYTNLNYQHRVLNRLADMAWHKGGQEYCRKSLDNATRKIWAALDDVYGRSPEQERGEMMLVPSWRTGSRSRSGGK